MATSNQIYQTTKALLQALKVFLNGVTNNVPNEEPVQVSIYTSVQARDNSGDTIEEKYPCVILEGPTVEENRSMRLLAVEDFGHIINEASQDHLTYKERDYPRYYNLIFRIVAKANNFIEFLNLQEKLNAFFQKTYQANGYQLGVTAAIGSLERPKLTDLMESAGEIIVRNVKIYVDEDGVQGDLIGTVELGFGDMRTMELLDDPEEKVIVTEE